MVSRTVARRYAKALSTVAVAAGKVDDIEKELTLVVQTLEKFPELKTLLRDPKVTAGQKKQALVAIFKDRVSEPVLNLLRLLVDKKRQEYIPEIYEAYQTEADRLRGIIKAEVKAARQLSPELMDQLQQKLEKFTGKKVRMVFREEPGLLGGVLVRIGDTVYDGTISTRLSRLADMIRLRQTAVAWTKQV